MFGLDLALVNLLHGKYLKIGDVFLQHDGSLMFRKAIANRSTCLAMLTSSTVE